MEVHDMQPIESSITVANYKYEVVYRLRDLQTREVESHTVGPYADSATAAAAMNNLCGQDWKGATFLGATVRAVGGAGRTDGGVVAGTGNATAPFRGIGRVGLGAGSASKGGNV